MNFRGMNPREEGVPSILKLPRPTHLAHVDCRTDDAKISLKNQFFHTCTYALLTSTVS